MILLSHRHFIIGYQAQIILLESNIEQFESKQKLYALLKIQYDAELDELICYVKLLSNISSEDYLSDGRL
jgi:hypothetical protein